MTEAERRYRGQRASPGLAAGPLVSPLLAPARAAPAPATGDPSARLHAALAQAGEELAGLAEREGGDASAILELQREMLRDPVLVEDVLPGIARGEDPAEAWWRSLSARIEGFRQAADELVRGRAADIADLRERVHRILLGRPQALPALPPNAILLIDDLTPSGFLSLDWHRLAGAALRAGSPSGHVAVLARGRGVPLVTGLGAAPEPAGEAMLDGETATLVVAPRAATRAELLRRESRRRRVWRADRREMAAAARTRDGTRVSVRLNVDDPGSVTDDVLQASEGVGLVRTETLFLAAERPPETGDYAAAYQGLLSRLGPGPCVLRTLDLGGDKPLGAAGRRFAERAAGLRGLRLCLALPELFRPQIRALLRAAVDPRVRVMFPMVATVADFEAARGLFTEELAGLEAAGEVAAMPPLGMMVETPEAAAGVGDFPADFYAIGSNDLTHAVLGAPRERPLTIGATPEPAVLRLIGQVVRFGQTTGREISLCGELAAEPQALAALLATGLRHLSVAPASFAAVKQQIRRLDLSSVEVE